MARGERSRFPAALEELGGRVEHWRQTRAKLSPMPEALWREAVSLAREHGVFKVSRAARLSYGSLKRRLEGSGAQEPARGLGGAAGFIELDPLRLFGAAEPAGPLLELSGADGSKLVIRLSSGKAVDVLGLAAAFWSRGT